jgi:phosphomannomutase
LQIKFGTDGWRGIIDREFNTRNVRFCAQGASSYIKSQGLTADGVIIGYDTRRRSDEFAKAVAEVTAGNGIPTTLCDRPAPTPTVSYAVVGQAAAGGVVITASHNPPEWNGFKYKPGFGGSAGQDVVDDLELRIADAHDSGIVQSTSLEEAERIGLFTYMDPLPSYLGQLASLVDLRAIRDAGLKVVADGMHGTGGGLFSRLLNGGTTQVTDLRADPDPSFPGMVQPEPIAGNLSQLMTAVPSGSADIGLANDADADRLGVVDENGRYITTLQAFALICLHQLKILGKEGPLVRSITMTRMIDRLAEKYEVPVYDAPVGFKHLGQAMMEQNALLVGEESGGYAFRGHIPERDGILSGLMILEMMVKTGKSVSGLIEMLNDEVGPYHYDRWDLEIEPSERREIESRLSDARPDYLAGYKVESIDTRDGLRYGLERGHWVLIRFSGTEPLLRIYAEASSPDDVQDLLSEARGLAGV